MSPSQFCTRCGTALSPETGLCPRCLLETGLAPEPSSARREPPAVEALAPHFPGHRIERLVGRGGMGAVYRALELASGRTVALKLLLFDAAARPDFAERFAREARTLESLDHPSIVAFRGHGIAGPWPWLAMEWIEGIDLRQRLRQGAIAPADALRMVVQLCEALQYAHERGVVHRDIKPENLLLDASGHVRILDFGLAKLMGAERDFAELTLSHSALGTPLYMAPEQFEHPSEVDHRADIYSLGVVFYELLTGEVPMGRFAPPSRKVAIDVRLDEVVLRALDREPEQRWQQARDVRREVCAVSPDSGQAPPSAPSHSRITARERLWRRARSRNPQPSSHANTTRGMDTMHASPAPRSRRFPLWFWIALVLFGGGALVLLAAVVFLFFFTLVPA